MQLADAVESCGGSAELITILNRLGVTASLDTLKRHIHSISEKRKQAGIDWLLVDKAFTVASADNIDFLSSYAAVYAGCQHRSWHATSVQLIQPRPQSCMHQSQPTDDSCVAQETLPPIVPTPITVPTPVTVTDVPMRTQPIAAGSMPTCGHTADKYHTTLHRKKRERSSPCSSPKKLTRSPCPKRYKRARTFSEARKHTSGNLPGSHRQVNFQRQDSHSAHSIIQYEAFEIHASESECLERAGKVMFQYMLQKEALTMEKILLDLKAYYGCASAETIPAEKSTVVYLSIVDKHADTVEAMDEVLSKLYIEYKVGTETEHLLVVGDQKTFSRLCELKHAYGRDLDWLIPFLGDWHLLKNYQSVLMNVYYHAGLKELAEAAGFRGETLSSLSKCSNFKRTHRFILQVWEGIYRHMIGCFLSKHPQNTEDMLLDVKRRLEECNQECTHSKSSRPLKEYLAASSGQYNTLHKEFQDYLTAMADKDDNWKFWNNFVFRDAYAYVTLFISIRGGLWKVRTGSIKMMASLFTAFDRPHYRKILPQHLRDLQTLPKNIYFSVKREHLFAVFQAATCTQ